MGVELFVSHMDLDGCAPLAVAPCQRTHMSAQDKVNMRFFFCGDNDLDAE